MKIGILHLSDLHIQDNKLIGRIDNLVNAITLNVNEQSHLYIALSGDITNYGRQDEFANAKIFVNTLKEKLKEKNRILQIQVIVVPGNHDCCFDEVKATRKIIIDSCVTDIVEEEDYFKDAMAVQSNFWKFAKEVSELKDDFQVAYKYEFIPHIDFKLIFHCYNTSWLTEITEEQGKLVIPENKFLENKNGEYVISLFHHPIDWLSANTKNNNKQRFEEHLINTSNLVLYGHEHDTGKTKGVVQRDNSVVFCGGKAFDNKEIKETGFSLYEIDTVDKSVNVKAFSFDESVFSADFNDTYEIKEKTKQFFILSSEFEKKITELRIPLKHSKQEKLFLSDVFIFPDLEPLHETDAVQYINSSDLIGNIKINDQSNVLIEGADQSGKTSLLFVIFKKLFETGLTPIYLRGKDCNDSNIHKLIKKSLKEQYNKTNVDLFLQCEKQIILLDNFHKSTLNSKYKKRLIESLTKSFKYIIITSDNSYNSQNITEEATTLKDFSKYKLLPLGHEKRNELIEKWLLIGENKYTIQQEEILQNVKYRFNEINALIGNRLMPPYPIFILTLLQGLDENLQNFSQTSYANIVNLQQKVYHLEANLV